MPRAKNTPISAADSGRLAEAARNALTQLAAAGGAAHVLPATVTRREAVQFLHERVFHTARWMGVLPGVQPRRGGAWACDRDTFVAWLLQWSEL